MDFLASLQVDDLPEGQTRPPPPPPPPIQPSDEQQKEQQPSLDENNLHLGFNACCTCAKPLPSSHKERTLLKTKNTPGVFICKECRRIQYCSKKCQMYDADPSVNSILSSSSSSLDDGDGDGGSGHSPIICALLKLCSLDEAMETYTSTNQFSSNHNWDKDSMEASKDRIRSEYESYPATLANLLMDAPCFQSLLKSTNKKQQQQHQSILTIHIVGASEESELWGGLQQHDKITTTVATMTTHNHKTLDNTTTSNDPYNAYAEAFTDVAHQFDLNQIHLLFIGPDCPKINQYQIRTIPNNDDDDDDDDYYNSKKKKRNSKQGSKSKPKKSRQLHVKTYRHHYNETFLSSLNPSTTNKSTNTKSDTTSLSSSSSSSSNNKNNNNPIHSQFINSPDLIVFFNPGFTCPDYTTWDNTLQSIISHCLSQTRRIPFFVTTNTEMEAVADCQYLWNGGYISSLPSMIANILKEEEQEDYEDEDDNEIRNNNVHHHEGEEKEEDYYFFGQNPYAGSRIRQSGTMANDLYVKSRWMFGGLLLSGSSSSSKQHSNERKKDHKNEIEASSSSSSSNRKEPMMTTKSQQQQRTMNDDSTNKTKNKKNKKKLSKSSFDNDSERQPKRRLLTNTKKTNPALI